MMLMRKTPFAALCLLALMCGAASAQSDSTRAKDEETIRAIVSSLAEAWTSGDAEASAKHFTEDAYYTIWFGRRIKGREEIARGHEQIFKTIYKDTKQKLEVRSVRFVRDDVALVLVDGSVVKKTEDFPASPHVVPLLVFTKEKGAWSIVAFQNTLVQTPPR